MSRAVTLERYLGYLDAQMQEASRGTGPRARRGRHRPVITISRQAGAGSHVFAEELIARLASATGGPWTIVDRDLVARVLEDHHLPAKLARFMPEDRVSETADTLDQLFGLRPSSWTLVRKTSETILRLAELGNVVLIGRGANFITRDLDQAFHVRLVGSFPVRVRHIMAYKHLDEHAAEEYVRSEDLKRRAYVRKYFEEDIDSPLHYHLVIDTDRLSHAEAAGLVGHAVLARASHGADAKDTVGAGIG